MSDIELTEGTPEDVAANFLREAFLQGKHGPAYDWRLWQRAGVLTAAIEKAVREQIAREIACIEIGLGSEHYAHGFRATALEDAARIARGES